MLLFLGHPAVMQSFLSKDIVEIRVLNDFSDFLKSEKVWTQTILERHIKTIEFLSTDPRDRDILLCLIFRDIVEVSFRDKLLTVRISENGSWDKALSQISEVMTEHLIVPKI